MPLPEITSAEAYESYIGGKCLRASRGVAWREIKACVVASPRIVDIVHLPAVSEPFIAWTISGEAEFQEREGNRHGLRIALSEGLSFSRREEAFTTVGGRR